MTWYQFKKSALILDGIFVALCFVPIIFRQGDISIPAMLFAIIAFATVSPIILFIACHTVLYFRAKWIGAIPPYGREGRIILVITFATLIVSIGGLWLGISGHIDANSILGIAQMIIGTIAMLGTLASLVLFIDDMLRYRFIGKMWQ